MVIKSRWKAAHDRFPAHVEEAKNSDGNVHRGYHLLEFRVAAELLRIGPVHSAEDYWAPNDWQLLLVVSEYMSSLLEFLDWFWPDLGWEHHKQAIVLSKRLLQPRSPYTYPELQIDPQLLAAWRSFTYCFWHGTRHLPTTPPPGDPPAIYSASRDWLTKLVGKRGFEVDGHIVSSLQSWIQATRPRLCEAFPAVDWSRWPSVVWPEPECGCRVVERRGALKRRQQEEDYAVRWPLRVTQGRPKFNHLKMEARDGFVVGIPPIKNPPALGFLAISDVMCAFKQAAQTWPPAVPLSPSYSAQQDVVQSFVQNVLRETRGPLAPGIAHEQYKYLSFIACCALGWQSALLSIGVPLYETGSWGNQPLVLPGGMAAPLPDRMHAAGHPPLGLNMGMRMGMLPPLGNMGLNVAAQLGLQPQLQQGPEAVGNGVAGAALSPQPLAAAGEGVELAAGGFLPGAAAASPLTAPTGVAISNGVSAAPSANGGSAAHGGTSATVAEAAAASQPATAPGEPSQQGAPSVKPTRTRPSPFLSRQASAAKAQAGAMVQPQSQSQPQVQAGQGPSGTRAQGGGQPGGHPGTGPERVANPEGGPFDNTVPMSLGGLSSMQDLIDGLPSQADLSWSTILNAVVYEEGNAAAAAAGTSGPGPSGQLGVLSGALPSFSQLVLPPGWPSLKPSPWLMTAAAVQQLANGAAVQPLANGTTVQPLANGAAASPALHEQLSGGAQSPSSLHPGLSGLSLGPSALQPYDSGLPCGTLHYPMCTLGGVLPPPRTAPDAPVHIQPPCLAGSPFQGTITTGSLPAAGLAGGAARAEPALPEPRLARRSHGEVFTLSPVTSCGPNVETMPSSPAITDPSGRRSQEGSQRAKDGGALPTGGRRTRQDVAAAAAAAAQDAGLPPAPGSLVERSSKRANAQAEPGPPRKPSATTAERVESLGAFLTDQQAGLGPEANGPQQETAASALDVSASAPGLRVIETTHSGRVVVQPLGCVRSSVDLVRKEGGVGAAGAGGSREKALGQQLLQLLRGWAEGPADATDASNAEVRQRAAELLERGAPADVAEEVAEGGAGPRAGFSALHWVCLRGDRPLAEALLRHGADPDQQDAAGVPARLANPDFEATVAELAGRERQRADARRAAGQRGLTSAFASSAAASAVAAAASSSGTPDGLPLAAAEGRTDGHPLRQHLVTLLLKADQLAGQLAQQDPDGAPQLVLQAIQGTSYLSQWFSSEALPQRSM